MSLTTPSRPLRTGRTTLVATLALVVALGLAGCQTPRDDGTADGKAGSASGGSGQSSAGPDAPTSSDDLGTAPAPADTPTPSATPVAVDLTVSVDATGAGAVTRHTLTCVPTGGDHPDAEAACAAIAAAGGAAGFEPTPSGTACTEQWGGPQVATVDGTVGDRVVHARFDRHDGCAISRWDRLAALFGPDAGLL